MANFGSPIMPTTPTKAPNPRRGEAVRRQLQLSTPSTTMSTTAQTVSTPSTISQSVRIGSLVCAKTGPRHDSKDIGMVLAKSGDECEVMWQSDSSREKIKTDTIKPWDANPNNTPSPVKIDDTDGDDHVKFKELIPTKVPTDLVCPLHSQDLLKIQTFQLRADSLLTSGHPNVNKAILGEIDNPLQYFDEVINLLKLQSAPAPFTFDPRKMSHYIEQVRSLRPELMPRVDKLLDNGRYYDGYRPVNFAIYSKLVECLNPSDLWILRQVERGDGIGLRNLLWQKMQGGTPTQRKLAALKTPLTVSDIKYKFEYHGIDKYFAAVHRKIGSFKTIGRVMDNTTALTEVFQHLEMQCLEYKKEIDEQRKEFVKDESNVTLQSLQVAMETVETTNGLGVTSKGTPIPKAIPMIAPPASSSIQANSASFAGSKNAAPPKSGPSTHVNETNARQNYGAAGSHQRGICKYPMHYKEDDHCYEGCSKCGGCFFFHKRKRLIAEGKEVCDHPDHKYAVHLKSECKLSRGANNYNRRSNHPQNRRGGHRQNHTSSHRSNHRSRNSSRRRDNNSSRYREQRRLPANTARPNYFDRVDRFARSRSRSRSPSPNYRHTRSRSRSRSRSRDNRRKRQTSDRRHKSHDKHDRSNRQKSSRRRETVDINAFRVSTRSRSPMSEGREAGRYQSGLNDDGLCDKWLVPIIQHGRKQNENSTHRLVIGAANAGVSTGGEKKKTVLDSGAGRPIFDDDALYEPTSKRHIDADVVWGDGSVHPVKYEGTIGPISGCVNTGGAADANLLGVSTTIDSLQQKFQRKISVIFDEKAAYIFKDLTVNPHPIKRGRYEIINASKSSGMLTAVREKGDSGVYEVPMHEHKSIQRFDAKSVHTHALLTAAERDAATPRASKKVTIFQGIVEVPSANKRTMSRELQRLHNCFAHSGQQVMRKMLLLSGTQKHKRLSKKVHELQPLCNCCLEGASQAQPHSRDSEQPTSRSTRPLQRVCSDSAGKNNIPTLGGALFPFIIVCQFSKYCWLWMLKSTSQVTGVVKRWLQTTIKQNRLRKTNPDRAIEFWRSDNGPEFPRKFTSMLEDQFGITHERSGSKASQHNADAESWINVLKKRCRTSLVFARAPRPWYGEAYCHVCVALNHVCRLSNPNSEPPITTMYGRKPDISKLKPFGCLTFINVPKKSRNGDMSSAAHLGVLMGYVTGSDGRILAYRVYDFDTCSFKHPYDVTFNVDVPALPYIASLKQLAPPVRLINRSVMKKWNGTPYYGTITNTRQDKDGETLYCVRYADNDYEEYSFLEVMRYLQPYDPFQGEDDNVEISPFFGSNINDLSATDGKTVRPTATPTSKASSAPEPPKNQRPTPSRKSSRVRVLRNIHSLADGQHDDPIPSSINSSRSRKAYHAKVKAYHNLRDRRKCYASTMRRIIQARAARKRSSKKIKLQTLVPEIVIGPDVKVDTLPVPKSYEGAVTGPYRRYWIKAISTELANLHDHKVWRVQRKPSNVRPIKGMFVFKWKPNADGTLASAKARFTMKGYSQQRGIHYEKTYASVAALMTVYLTCIVANELNYSLHQTDLKAAYLTAPLEPNVEMFIEPPPGVNVPEGMGLRVVQALYGSMQGAARLDCYKQKRLTELGFIRSCAEPSLYYMPKDSPFGLVLLSTVVDDFLLACKREHIEEVKNLLRSVWKLTDGGPVKWFLNLKFSRDRRNGVMKIDQSTYAEIKLREYGLDNDPSPLLPMRPELKLSKSMGPENEIEKKEMEQVPYRSMTGSANYFRMTRPDLAVATSICSQFNSCYGRKHVRAVKHLLRHAGGTKHWGVGFARSGTRLIDKWIIEVWVDAAHAVCPDTRRSRTGFFITLNGNLLSHKSKLQPGVPSQSSTEAEYRALSDALNEVVWIVMVLNEIGIQVEKPIRFQEDNTATIKLGENNMSSKRSKHIALRHHVIRYHNSKGTIALSYCETSDMIADMLTKCLALPNFRRLRNAVMTDAVVECNDEDFNPDCLSQTH